MLDQDIKILKYITKLPQLIKNPSQYLNKKARFDRMRKFLARYLPETLAWDEFYMKYTYWRYFGKKLDLKNPRTFNEKLRWIMLYDRNPLYTHLADKYLVRDYVRKCIGTEYLNPLIGAYNETDEIDWESLPEKFVIKLNHGSHWNIICPAKASVIREDTIKKINEWKSQNFYHTHREFHYKNIDKKILVEEFISETSKKIECNFYCFNGNPVFIEANIEHENKNFRVYYDMSWNIQPFEIRYHAPFKSIDKPKNLNKMIEIAEMISSKIPFCRVDLYNLSGKIVFGEITITPGAGYLNFVPKEYDLLWGNLMDITVN